ncbi:MAG: TRAP transporter large permease subunit, partial [Deltaproteobacteria bacterium]
MSTGGGRARALLSTLPVVVLLGVVILHGLGEAVHARLLQVGEHLYPGYAELREDPTPPTCDPNAATEAPAEAPSDQGEDDAFLDDLLGDDGEADAGAAAAAARAAAQRCKAEHERYAALQARITPSLRVFRALEGAVAAFVQTGVSYLRHTLVLLLLLCALTATAFRLHIALRPVQTRRDLLLSEGVSALATLALTVSSYFKWQVDLDSGLRTQNAAIPILWMVGFGIMTLLSVRHLLRPPADLEPGGSWTKALLAIPLFAVMGVVGAIHFFLWEGHASGLAIYLQKLSEHALLYLHVGLYVWAGMLLKRTRLAHLTFDLVRPWKLPPELLAFVVVAGAAIPTAYSGASGIFVIAAGSVIYTELIRAGARPQLALAATAMSGSLGVVLSPCLLVVIVASLNKQVTTTQLYGWGWKVFLLTATLFFVASLIVGRKVPKIEAPGRALRGTLAALRPLLPYALILSGLLLVYGLGLDTVLNEHTAPAMLPVLLLALLAYDRRAARREARLGPHAEGAEYETRA